MPISALTQPAGAVRGWMTRATSSARRNSSSRSRRRRPVTTCTNKLRAYRRNGIQEYIVWRTFDRAVDWFFLHEDRYDPLPPDEAGRLRSRVFPGLWLDPAALVDGDPARLLAALREGLAGPETRGVRRAVAEHDARTEPAGVIPERPAEGRIGSFFGAPRTVGWLRPAGGIETTTAPTGGCNARRSATDRPATDRRPARSAGPAGAQFARSFDAAGGNPIPEIEYGVTTIGRLAVETEAADSGRQATVTRLNIDGESLEPTSRFLDEPLHPLRVFQELFQLLQSRGSLRPHRRPQRERPDAVLHRTERQDRPRPAAGRLEPHEGRRPPRPPARPAAAVRRPAAQLPQRRRREPPRTPHRRRPVRDRRRQLRPAVRPCGPRSTASARRAFTSRCCARSAANGMIGEHRAFRSVLAIGKGHDEVTYSLERALDRLRQRRGLCRPAAAV